MDFRIGRSFKLMGQMEPFILFRMLVYVAMSFAYVIGIGTGAGIGWAVGALGAAEFRAGATLWGAVAGFGLTAGVIYLIREYIFYLMKAGHIAVLVE